jgi:very-short-patch-repair endonuclease
MRRDPQYTARAREMRNNATAAETRMWQILRAKQMGGFKFRRQHALGQYIADFICLQARLVIEVDGDTHGDDRVISDQQRTDYMEKIGFRVMRFWNHDVLNYRDDVADAIANELVSCLRSS